MPIISKTFESSQQRPSNYLSEASLNMAKALSAAVGSEYKEITESANNIKYCVPMESVGYPGWCVVFATTNVDGAWMFNSGIYLYDDINKTPVIDDINALSYNYAQVGSYSGMDYTPETCVMISDSTNDVVLLDIHQGRTVHATDLSYSADSGLQLTLNRTMFFAKDVNDNVLCGIGNEGINVLRTANRKSTDLELIIDGNTPEQSSALSNILHLTKMVNYLSDDFAEMKSAYVSVVRPFVDVSEKKRVSLYDINGVLWGNAGGTDVWQKKRTHDHNYYFPFNPFVKY